MALEIGYFGKCVTRHIIESYDKCKLTQRIRRVTSCYMFNIYVFQGKRKHSDDQSTPASKPGPSTTQNEAATKTPLRKQSTSVSSTSSASKRGKETPPLKKMKCQFSF